MEMKRLISLVLLAGAIMACTKTVPAPKPDITSEGLTVVSADIETLLLGGEQARHWKDGDAIGLFGSETGNNEKYLLRKADANLSSATFYGPLVKGKTISAYYPYEPSFSGSATEMSATLESVQVYEEEAGAVEQFLNYCPRAYAFLRNDRLKFSYPFGVLAVKISLDEILTVHSLTLNSPSSSLSGLAVIHPDGATMAPGTPQEVKLLCNGGVASRDMGGNVREFFMITVPGTYEDLKLSIEVEGEPAILCELGSITIPRIDAAGFALASVTLKSGGPDSFEPVSVHFDE